MSSIEVRSAFKQFLSDNSEETFIDLTARMEEVRQLIRQEGLSDDAPWIGLEFQGDDEVPVQLAADNQRGQYRETGMVYVHVVTRARLGSGPEMLTRGEALRNLLRGRRIGAILVESVTPLNFGPGATLEFESGYQSGSFFVGYTFDRNL